MASHDYHEALEGYDPRQILHDGCGECEARGKDVGRAIANLDAKNFQRAWQRAFDSWAAEGSDAKTGPISVAEAPLLSALWAVQLQLDDLGALLIGELAGSRL